MIDSKLDHHFSQTHFIFLLALGSRQRQRYQQETSNLVNLVSSFIVQYLGLSKLDTVVDLI